MDFKKQNQFFSLCFAGEKLLDLISFCICPVTFASALNMFHLEPSCQVGFVPLSLFSLYCIDPCEGDCFLLFSSSVYNKSSCCYHCTALVFGIDTAFGMAGLGMTELILS